MTIGRAALIAFAVFAVAFSLFNASWIAPKPEEPLVLVAHRGVAQPVEQANGGECSARLTGEAGHDFIENTIFSMHNAVRFGARSLMLDVRPTVGGRMVVFRDSTLDCRTEAEGPVSRKTLAELQQLDVGYGYTPDGTDFPLRGRGVGAMPSVADVLREFPEERLIFNIREGGAPAARALLAEFERAGVEVADRHGFTGEPAALTLLDEAAPAGWTLKPGRSDACFADYLKLGWTGMLPDTCRDTMLALALKERNLWTVWGWPYRFLDRMRGAGTETMVLSERSGDSFVGLDRTEQLNQVPRQFPGMLLIEDMYHVGRALRP